VQEVVNFLHLVANRGLAFIDLLAPSAQHCKPFGNGGMAPF
jgi:hypothetical protein